MQRLLTSRRDMCSRATFERLWGSRVNSLLHVGCGMDVTFQDSEVVMGVEKQEQGASAEQGLSLQSGTAGASRLRALEGNLHRARKARCCPKL